MSNRHLSRSIVLQSLFEWDFNKAKDFEASEIFGRVQSEFAPHTDDKSFMEDLFNNVISKIKDLDNLILKAAPDWPLEKISIVDRNILRIGLYELLFSDKNEVPPKVAINEAIELAKTFGGDNSSKFVNGVLGSVYKEIGEPNKDSKSGRQNRNDTSGINIPSELLTGSVVYALDENQIYLALVHDVFGHWTLSKSKIKVGETEHNGVMRGVLKELGVMATPETELGTNQYITYDPEKGKIKKIVKYFLAKSPFEELHLGKSGGLDDARWFKLKDILDLNFYDDIMPIITKAIKILAEQTNDK